MGEKDGVDYHFITTEEFKEKQKNGFFAEVGEYNGWFYGSAVEDCTNDKVAVLTPHGMRQLRNKADIDIFCVYIKVPRRDRLIKILQRNDNIEEAKRRDASDVGQFDGIEDEADCIIENKGYSLSPDSMAKYTDRYYSEHLVDKNKIYTILCDVDEVVNDLVEKLLVEYNRKYNDNLNLNDITKWEVKDFLKPECENIFKEFGTDDFLSSLGMQPKAKEVIEKLMEKYKFYFVTSTYPDHVRVKDEWLKRIFPKYNSAGNRFYSLPRSAVIRHCTPEGSELFPLTGQCGYRSLLRTASVYRLQIYSIRKHYSHTGAVAAHRGIHPYHSS